MKVVLKFWGGSMSLTGFVETLCDMEANGRMGREGVKWGLRCGNDLGGAVAGVCE